MKKKILIAAAICASLFVVVPTGYVSAAEIETESIPQRAREIISVNSTL